MYINTKSIYFITTCSATPQEGGAGEGRGGQLELSAGADRRPVPAASRHLMALRPRRPPGGPEGSWRPRVWAGPALPPRPPPRRPADWRAACVHTRDRANSAGRPPDLTRCGGQWARPLARRRQACAGEKDPGSARRGGGARRRVGPGAGGRRRPAWRRCRGWRTGPGALPSAGPPCRQRVRGAGPAERRRRRSGAGRSGAARRGCC